ncbi:hypothetical protein Ddc_23569 [Ditylenchus destructor]|nr:hypothetical protein Ddc_23569 [Ditylenchus destructor]
MLMKPVLQTIQILGKDAGNSSNILLLLSKLPLLSQPSALCRCRHRLQDDDRGCSPWINVTKRTFAKTRGTPFGCNHGSGRVGTGRGS